MTKSFDLEQGGYFVCAICHQRFQTTWTAKDAKKEYEGHWGPHMGEDMEITCEECYRKFMNWMKSASNTIKGEH